MAQRQVDKYTEQLTYLESSLISIARMLSVCPTSLLVRLPLRGSHMRTTRSGDPEAMTEPYGSVANAYTDALGPDASGALRVINGSCAVRVGSHILMVRSKEPDASHWRSRLLHCKHGAMRI